MQSLAFLGPASGSSLGSLSSKAALAASTAAAAPLRPTDLPRAASEEEVAMFLLPTRGVSAAMAAAGGLVAGVLGSSGRRKRKLIGSLQVAGKNWRIFGQKSNLGQGASLHCAAVRHASTVLRAVPEVAEEVKEERPIRVRFAPSPTGVLHVGGARTALFNWLFAKSQGGQMILRVEDTDTARSTAESEAAILEGLKWCGISWDEGPDIGGGCGPYRQTDRIKEGIYEKRLEELVAGGNAYKCFLSKEELDEMRATAEKLDQAFVIQSPWATAKEEDVQAQLDAGKPYVYRFRVPFDREIVVDDLVLGEVTWNSDDLGGDFVIVRQNSIPMYNFGVVVDDATMDISHVLRAQEHLMNTPRQILIYEALGFEVPRFAHMPLILAPDRSKLSKRHGAVSVGEYQRLGYLPSGMVNYLAQLGWNDGTKQEIYSLEELLQSFKMNRMSKVAAIFDSDKFKWVNGHHVRNLSDEEAFDKIGSLIKDNGLVKEASGEFVRKASSLLRDRIGTLAEAAEELKMMMHFDLEDLDTSEAAKPYLEDGSIKETAKLIVEAHARGELENLGADPEVFKNLVKSISEARGGVKKKALQKPLRLALMSNDHGPEMNKFFDMLRVANEDVLCECVQIGERIDKLKQKFEL
eukprot:TRINITY_DN95990_c0_g1_i1.p1 TRINITY_DN95990_c0_g1~~TRINITY_DN95990_c0_g1_i1.p1  ORF type:complete len:636 (-),score=143.03 TRINITY_DN95990_c0_g1_i1:89-1996(-)